jgi:hypothetical protein
MSKKGEPRKTTGKFSDKTPGLPHADLYRADRRLRNFAPPPEPSPVTKGEAE